MPLLPTFFIRYGEQIAALEQKYRDILIEISSFKHTYLVSVVAQPHNQHNLQWLL